jgi:hypothetical protein
MDLLNLTSIPVKSYSCQAIPEPRELHRICVGRRATIVQLVSTAIAANSMRYQKVYTACDRHLEVDGFVIVGGAAKEPSVPETEVFEL